MRLWLILALCASGFTATVRVSCGGPGGVDSQGNIWTPYGPIASGYPYSVSGQQPPYANLVFSEPASAPLVLTVTPPGTSGTVTLKFIEPSKTAVGQRRFSVIINGTQVVKDLDLFAVAGLLKPYDLTFPFSASPVVITLTPTSPTDKAVVSGIQIGTMDAAPVPWEYPHAVMGLESTPPPCPSSGISFFYTTDTHHLFWCTMFDGGTWHTVGDVRNWSPALGAAVVPGVFDLESCSGGIDYWDCNGIRHAQATVADGIANPMYQWTSHVPVNWPCPKGWVFDDAGCSMAK
jgi:hypothetical protein